MAWFVIRTQKYGALHKYATQKRTRAKKSVQRSASRCVRACSSEDAQTAIRSERDAECVRVRAECESERVKAAGEYPTGLVGIKMRYDLHATSNDRAPAPAPRAARAGASAPPLGRSPTIKRAIPTSSV